MSFELTLACQLGQKIYILLVKHCFIIVFLTIINDKLGRRVVVSIHISHSGWTSARQEGEEGIGILSVSNNRRVFNQYSRMTILLVRIKLIIYLKRSRVLVLGRCPYLRSTDDTILQTKEPTLVHWSVLVFLKHLQSTRRNITSCYLFSR